MRRTQMIEIIKTISWLLLFIFIIETLMSGREKPRETPTEGTLIVENKSTAKPSYSEELEVVTTTTPKVFDGVLKGLINPLTIPPSCPICAGRTSCSESPNRPLKYIVNLESENWPNPDYCIKEGYQSLCKVLKKTAINRQVLVAVANSAAPGLSEFITNIKEKKIQNLLVAALDNKVTHMLDKWNVSYWESFDNATGNHKVSAKKFGIIRKIIQLGVSVLLSDTDVVYFSNPFSYLGGDTDIESMSDGWDIESSFSFNDTITDVRLSKPDHYWPKSLRIQALNSGLWYVAATESSDYFLSILSFRMQTESTWDQEAFFTELLSPSYEDRTAAPVSVRVLSPYCFMNSKVLMRIIRPYLLKFGYGSKEKMTAADNHGPISLHANYHTDKPVKMKQADSLYNKRNPDALDKCYCGSDNVCGCDSEVQTVSELEKPHEDQVTSSYTNSDDHHKSTKFLLSGCKPGDQSQPHQIGTSSPSLPDLHWINKTYADPVVDLSVIIFKDSTCDKSLLIATRGALKHYPEHIIKVVDSIKGKWKSIEDSLAMGKHVLIISDDTIVLKNPMEYLYRDSDVEVASDGWDIRSAAGYDHIVDDPKMGWSRYCHGYRIVSRDPGFVFLNPTVQSKLFATRMLSLLSDSSSDVSSEHLYFNELLFRPNFANYRSPSVTRRTCGVLCFITAKTAMNYFRSNPMPSPVIVRLQSVQCDHKEEYFSAITRHFIDKDSSKMNSLKL